MSTSAGARNIWIFVVFLAISCFGLFGQYHSYGKITFERKTNLLKKYNDNRMKRFINEDNKIKIDEFELLFNDTSSVFRPILVAEEGKMSWLTTKKLLLPVLAREISVYDFRIIWAECLPQRLLTSEKLENHK
jgi:hypothetical protein